MRDMRRARRRWILVLAAGLAMAVAAAWLWLGPDSKVTRSVPVDGGALLSADGLTVSVTEAVGCAQTDALLSAESGSRVIITVRSTEPRRPPCAGIPGFAVYHTRLSAPLGRRTLIDGATGKPVPYFPARLILRPGYLPAGYRFSYAAPAAPYGPSMLTAPIGARVSCAQIYSAGGETDPLTVTQSVGGKLIWPSGSRRRRLVAHGHPALAIPGRVSWTENGQTVVVSDLAEPTSALVAVADSLR